MSLCPLRFNSYHLSANKDCVRENCAWWIPNNEESGKCAIVQLSISLNKLNNLEKEKENK